MPAIAAPAQGGAAAPAQGAWVGVSVEVEEVSDVVEEVVLRPDAVRLVDVTRLLVAGAACLRRVVVGLVVSVVELTAPVSDPVAGTALSADEVVLLTRVGVSTGPASALARAWASSAANDAGV